MIASSIACSAEVHRERTKTLEDMKAPEAMKHGNSEGQGVPCFGNRNTGNLPETHWGVSAIFRKLGNPFPIGKHISGPFLKKKN